MVADDCIDHELRRTYREDDDMSLTDLTPVPQLPEPAERARLRRLFGVTQIEVAGHIGVTRQMVNRYERGLSEPAGRTREKYAALLTAWAATEKKEG